MVDKQKNFNMDIKYSLQGKYSLITGASGLLGEQHAVALLMLNSNVILTDIDFKKLFFLKKKLVRTFPNLKIMIFKMDVTSERSIKKTAKDLEKKKIKVNILINNAAIDSKIKNNRAMTNSGRFENTSSNEWTRHLNVGLMGSMLCSKVFGQLMSKNQKGGVILNISSDLSVIAPNHSIYKKGVYKPVMYSVIKHGLLGLTKYLATYWHRKKIRCNAISPGPVEHNQSKDFIKKLKKQIPLNRLAKKNEYISAVQFLCSDASSYMTGQNLIIDGGRSVW
jgi:NAD(P)-dependent dehydrogenase (short-subunit alcohol dehydrogenase family)